MGKNYYLLKWTAFLFLVVSIFTSCEKEMDKYYEDLDVLKGNAWEILEEEGNYSIFLRGIEKIGFKDMMDGKGIITVIAPDDNAFGTYFEANGISSIEDMDESEILKLIGIHLVYYSYDKERFANYRPNGPIPPGETVDDAGLYYKFRTRSQDPYSYVADPTYDNEYKRKIYHKERFIPVFSNYLFQTKKIDPSSNYSYFFPQTEWRGETGTYFNISNANVDEYAIPTSNGYIYKVNKVIEPLETIDKLLAEENDYSVFKSLYNKFYEFYFDEQSTELYGESTTDSLFILYHSGELPKIASEWSYNGEETTYPDYAKLDDLSKNASNIFAPNNSAMNDFLNNYWYAGGYERNIDSLDFAALRWLIQSHVAAGDEIYFPEEISRGDVENLFGTTVDFDPTTAKLKKIAVNGTLYGLEEVIAPDLFYSIFKPAFMYKDYQYYMRMLMAASRSTLNVISNTNDIIMFIPDNDIIIDGGYAENTYFRWEVSNVKSYGGQNLQYQAGSEDWRGVNSAVAETVININTLIENMTPTRSLSEGVVYKTRESYQYVYLTDSEVVSPYAYNHNQSTQIPTYEPTNIDASNGTSYFLKRNGTNGALLSTDVNPLTYAFSRSVYLPRRYDDFQASYARFFDLISVSDYLDGTQNFPFLLGYRTMILAPTDDVIDDAIDNDILPQPFPELADFPTEDDYLDEVARVKEFYSDYLKRYFINVSWSNLQDYPFPSSVPGGSQTLATNDYTYDIATDTYYYQSISIRDDINSLTVIDKRGNEIPVHGFFPNIYPDGAAYLIEGLIEME